MEWFKKHVDTVIILTAFGSSIMWMNGKFNDVDKQFAQVDKQFAQVDKQFAQVDKQFAEIHQELAIIKTVLIMTKIMPAELASKENINENTTRH